MAFSPGKLQQVLSQVKAGEAAGPNDIAPDLLKHMSIKGSSVLSTILNSSWLSSWCPKSWCSAYVVPFHQIGKKTADVGSYGLTALTLIIGNVLSNMTALPIHVPLHQSPPGSGRHNQGMTHIGPSLVYIAVMCSVLAYPAVAWALWPSATAISNLDRVQLEAARADPVEAVLTKAQLAPISMRFQAISIL